MFFLVQSLSHVWLFTTPCTVARQASLYSTNSQSLLRFMSIAPVMVSNHLILCHFLLLLPSVFPSIRVFFQWVGSLHQVAEVLELHHQSFQWIFRTDLLQDWLVWSSSCPRGSWKSSPPPQFKNINSLVLSFLNGPTFTSIHNYCKNHSFTYTDTFW